MNIQQTRSVVGVKKLFEQASTETSSKSVSYAAERKDLLQMENGLAEKSMSIHVPCEMSKENCQTCISAHSLNGLDHTSHKPADTLGHGFLQFRQRHQVYQGGPCLFLDARQGQRRMDSRSPCADRCRTLVGNRSLGEMRRTGRRTRVISRASSVSVRPRLALCLDGFDCAPSARSSFHQDASHA
jgi:hypothetical protein